jgi:chemotaxis protein methyltransferase CheR
MAPASAARRKSTPIVLPASDSLSDEEFTRIADLVGGHTGIRLPAGKRTMVEGRIRKRMRAVGQSSFSGYCHYVFEDGGLASEVTHMIDAVTTNKTDFFREPEHFEVLRRQIVPDCLSRSRGAAKTGIKVWSAAASNGAEAYTIAMVLAETAGSGRKFDYSILGTDISTDILAQARRAVYPGDFVSPVPAEMQQRYLMRSRDPSASEVRIVPELRRRIGFMHLNLMDEKYPVDTDVDAIFLRNVLIYFDKPTQAAVVGRLLRHLRPGGYLLLGHSESMIGTSLRLKQLAPSVFKLV